MKRFIGNLKFKNKIVFSSKFNYVIKNIIFFVLVGRVYSYKLVIRVICIFIYNKR